MRLVTGSALLIRCVLGLWGVGPRATSVPTALLFAVLALLLLAGLWTPAAAALLAGIEVWRILYQSEDPWTNLLIGTLGAALAMLGPGAWSVDGYLFGWKRIDIRDRDDDANAP